uniref:Ig-like domain-containing protein n=1 Tax=Gopherus evgoodei TaxID=1825980 RepID=A0A8C4YU40_9SAUR
MGLSPGRQAWALERGGGFCGAGGREAGQGARPVDCNDLLLTRVPPGLTPDTHVLLSLFRNQLAWVPAPALRRLPLLQFLELNENPIGELRVGDFRGTPRLEQLSLSTLEQLIGVAEGAFDGLPKLAKLDLSHNPRLAYLHPAALQGAPALRTLLATDGALALLPAQLLASPPSLAALSLRGNPLRCDCPAAWQGLARLRLVEPGATLCAAPLGATGRPLREGLPGSGAPGDLLAGLVGVGLAHTGQYTCMARNEAGSASRILMLQVLGGVGWREGGSGRELGGRGGPALLMKKVQPNFVVLEWTAGGWSLWAPPRASLAPPAPQPLLAGLPECDHGGAGASRAGARECSPGSCDGLAAGGPVCGAAGLLRWPAAAGTGLVGRPQAILTAPSRLLAWRALPPPSA